MQSFINDESEGINEIARLEAESIEHINAVNVTAFLNTQKQLKKAMETYELMFRGLIAINDKRVRWFIKARIKEQ